MNKIKPVVFARSFKRFYSSKNCNEAITEAEKIVGYPTSFLNLRCLLSDEVADIANHMKKLMGTKHPLLKTAKDLIIKRDDMPQWGLIILLISKCQKSKFSNEISRDISEGISQNQRILAEVTELVRTSNIVHNSIQNAKKNDTSNYGNKLALLSGDYLLSTSFKLLAEMKNQEVNELISTALRDLNESNFFGIRDEQNRPLPSKPLKENTEIIVPVEFGTNLYKIKEVMGCAKSEWILRSLLGGGTLLAKAAEGAMLLTDNKKYRQNAHLFGRNIALAYKSSLELKYFKDSSFEEFDLTCAPILFHLNYDPGFYDVMMKGYEEVDYNDVRNVVVNGPGLAETLKLQKEFSDSAMEALVKFPENDARDALEKIINTM